MLSYCPPNWLSKFKLAVSLVLAVVVWNDYYGTACWADVCTVRLDSCQVKWARYIQKSHFQTSWLDKTDKNGHGVGLWLKEVNRDRYSAYCNLCSSKFDVSRMGWPAVLQHLSGKGHQASMHCKTSSAESVKQNQAAMTGYFIKRSTQTPTIRDNSHSKEQQDQNSTVAKTLMGTSSEGPMKQHLLLADQVTKAEDLWAMKTANAHLSFFTSDGLPALFCEMFPDSSVCSQTV